MLTLATRTEDEAVLLTAGGRLFHGRSYSVGRISDLEVLQLKGGDLAIAAAAGADGWWYLVTGRQDGLRELRVIRRE